MTRACVFLCALLFIAGCARNPNATDSNSKSGEDQQKVKLFRKAVGDPEFRWFNSLPNGGIHYPRVHQLMFWKEPTAFKVYVNGPAANTGQIDLKDMQSGALKVSRQMKVLLTCPDNPDAFTIKAEPGTKDVQDVPVGGVAQWVWDVTPQLTGHDQKLVARVWVIYPGQKGMAPIEQELFPSYTAVVNVHVPGFWEAIKRLFELDPDYWLHYGLPGGAGFAAIMGFLKWIFSLRRKRAQSSPRIRKP